MRPKRTGSTAQPDGTGSCIASSGERASGPDGLVRGEFFLERTQEEGGVGLGTTPLERDGVRGVRIYSMAKTAATVAERVMRSGEIASGLRFTWAAAGAAAIEYMRGPIPLITGIVLLA